MINRNLYIITDFFTPNLCRKYPNYLFIFGDNTLKKGKEGQASIRNELNSYGIPTKRYPGNNPNDYFSDKDYDLLRPIFDIHFLYLSTRTNIVFHKNLIGTGKAQMPRRCPKVYAYLQSKILNLFNSSNIIYELPANS